MLMWAGKLPAVILCLSFELVGFPVDLLGAQGHAGSQSVGVVHGDVLTSWRRDAIKLNNLNAVVFYCLD